MNKSLALPAAVTESPYQVAVPFDSYIEARARTLLHTEDLPPYLLLPEIQALLDATLNDHHRILFEFMWYTGARITEALMLTPKDLVLDQEMNSYASLQTLKRKTAGRVAKKPVRRMVPITDEYFILSLKRFVKTHRVKTNSPLFDFSRQLVHRTIKKSAVAAGLSIDVTPHTLRHSFAVNHLLHGQQIHDIKTWLGHTSIKTTEIYLQVLGADTSHLAARTRFRPFLET